MDDHRVGQAAAAAGMGVLALLVALVLLVQAALSTLVGAPGQLAGSLVFATKDPGCLLRLAQAFDAEQTANARTIVRTAQTLNVPPLGWILAVDAAIQESSLRNVGHGDAAGPDSLGLFQQRAAWGPARQRMDPAAATRLFLTGGRGAQPGLMDIGGWQQLPMTSAVEATTAIQAVQRSAYPHAYAEHVSDAMGLVLAVTAGTPAAADLNDAADEGPASAAGTSAGGGGAGAGGIRAGTARTARVRQAVAGSDCEVAAAQSGVVRTVLAFARSQIGVPYQWGGDGPASGERGFDCSGLTTAAYAAAGVTLPRTAQSQYDHGPRVSLKALLVGDLVFFGPDAHHVDHVGIYLGGHEMLDAPHTGALVRTEDYRWGTLLGATRPAAANA